MSQTQDVPKTAPALEANSQAMTESVVDVEESGTTGQDFSPAQETRQYQDADCDDDYADDTDLPLGEPGDETSSDSGDVIYSYEVPRPALTIEEAAGILGKSVRAIERSISGRWGNRLPEGWKARKMKLDGQVEWRILPPPGFRIRRSTTNLLKPRTQETDMSPGQTETQSAKSETSAQESGSKSTLDFGFSLEKLLSAGKKAGNELVKVAENAMENSFEQHPTIVIDRASDVEKLLRELADTQKELATERLMHLEDLRQMHEMASSMRLLEMRGTQTQILKEELEDARKALKAHKEQYEAYLALPWWKKMFVSAP